MSWQRLSLKQMFALVAIILLTGVLIYTFWVKKTPQKHTSVPMAESTIDFRRVFTSDFHTHLDRETQKSLEHLLYSYTNQAAPDDLYTGTIRDGSYTKETAPSKQEIINMLVDVEPVEVTYKVTLIGNPDSYSINIQCAPKIAQITPTSACRNIAEP